MTDAAPQRSIDFADLGIEETREAIAAAKPVSEGWSKPIPLPTGLPFVPPFDSKLLPNKLRAWSSDIADRMSVPLDFVAAPLIVAAGSVLGRKIGIRPQSRTDWTEPANLWGCIVGPPGSLKSPALREALSPIRLFEKRAAEKFAAETEAYDYALKLHKVETDAASQGARKLLKPVAGQALNREKAQAMIEAVRCPEPPVAVRFVTTDATAEKLGEICSDNPNGYLIHRDELLTMFADLDREEKASARGFLMTGWAGLDGYTYDRIGRGTVRIEAVNISVFGTTQPGRLAGYIRQSLRLHDDGMVQRLQILVWPDAASDWKEVDRHPDSEARQEAFGCFESLAAIDPEAVGAEVDPYSSSAIPYLRFSQEAQRTFSDFREVLERKIRSAELAPAMAAHLSKYRGLIPRLALISHLANGGIGPVTLEATQMALGWADYLESHMYRAYASVGCDNVDAAKAIWRRVQKGEIGDGFTARELKRHHWGGLTGDRVDQGLALLVEHDWLRQDVVETGGRPVIAYRINPLAKREKV